MDDKYRFKLYNSCIKANAKYLSDPTLENYVSQTQKVITKNLNKTDRAAVRTCLAQYAFLADWHSEKALSGLLSGNSASWSEIDLAFNYRYYNMRFDPCVTPVEMASVLLLHAIAKNDTQKMNWLFDYQIKSFTGNNPNTWNYSSAGVFGLALMCKLNNDQTSLNEWKKLKQYPNMESFENIFNHWNSPERITDGISSACDYHLQQTKTTSGYPDYVFAPYFVIPIEIIALISIRDLLGLTTILPKHVMINSLIFENITQFHASVGNFDEKYINILAKARTLLPEL